MRTTQLATVFIAVLVLGAGIAWAGGQPSQGSHTATPIAGGGGGPFIVDGVICQWTDGIWYIWDGDKYVGPNGGTVEFNTAGQGYQHNPAPPGTPSAGAYSPP